MERRIEEKRAEMYALVVLYGLSDPRVLLKSKELDALLNVYSLYREQVLDNLPDRNEWHIRL